MIHAGGPLTPSRPRRTVVAGLASLCLAAGCTDAGLIDDSSAAAAPQSSADTAIVDRSVTPDPPAAPPTPPETSPATQPALPTLDEVLAEEQFFHLVVALEHSGLGEVIDGLDDFVLLAPTSSAFTSAGADVGIEWDTLIDTPRLLEAVVRYHIVADPLVNVSWRTLNGAIPDVAPGKGMIDGVEVLDRIPVRNGVVLVMPQLLLPASDPARSQLRD